MTITDPFAQSHESQNVPEKEVESVVKIKRGPPPPPAPTSEGKIVLTFKEGTGFDSSWIVVHAGTVAEADALLDQSFADLMAKTKRVAAHFRGGSAPSSGGRATSGYTSSPGSAAPQGATQPPSWFPAPPAPDWVYKTGFKNGKTWHAWAPAEKGGGDWQFHRQP